MKHTSLGAFVMVLALSAGGLVAGSSSAVAEDARSRRERQIDIIAEGAKPSAVSAAWKAIVAIDLKAKGPCSTLSVETRKTVGEVLAGFVAGHPEKVLGRIEQLRSTGVDAVDLILSAVERWAFLWASDAVAERVEKLDVPGAEEIVQKLSAAFGSAGPLLDALRAQIEDGKVLVKAARIRQLMENGKPALAYFAIDMIPGLSDEERLKIQNVYTPRLEKMLQKLKYHAFVEGRTPAAVNIAELVCGVGEDWVIEYGKPNSAEAFYPVQVEIVSYRTQFKPPSLYNTETGTATYKVGTKMKANPEKKRCKEAVNDRRRELRDAEDRAAQQERQAAQNAAAMSNGVYNTTQGAVIGGLNEAIGVVNRVPVEMARAALSSAESHCYDVDDMIEVDEMEDVTYPISWYETSMVGTVTYVVRDVAHGRSQLAGDTIEDEARELDDVIHGNSRMNIPNDDLDLPAAAELEQALAAGYAERMVGVVMGARDASWNAIVADADTRSGEERAEILARLLLLAEIRGIELESRDDWTAEIEAAVTTEKQDSVERKR